MKRAAMLIILAVAALGLVGTAGANLFGTALGLPALTQAGVTTSFSRDTAVGTDNEAFSITWPGLADNSLTPFSSPLTMSAPILSAPMIASPVTAGFGMPGLIALVSGATGLPFS